MPDRATEDGAGAELHQRAINESSGYFWRDAWETHEKLCRALPPKMHECNVEQLHRWRCRQAINGLMAHLVRAETRCSAAEAVISNLDNAARELGWLASFDEYGDPEGDSHDEEISTIWRYSRSEALKEIAKRLP